MPSFVIRAEDLVLLNELVAEYPRPIGLAWINRGTNQKLRPSTVALLMRTLYEPIEFSDSVANLHKSAGLRVTFKCEHDRAEFAAAFQAVKKILEREPGIGSIRARRPAPSRIGVKGGPQNPS